VTRYLDLAEYLWLAEQVTGIDAATLAKASRIDLADSALHAPAAGFELLTADALLSRLVSMHPSRMRDAHRTTVASVSGTTDRLTIAALRRAKATQTADLMEALLKKPWPPHGLYRPMPSQRR